MAARRNGASRTKAQREFVSEAEEILDRLRADLLELEDARGADAGEGDPELINRIFRSAHSLKGLAGMFGYDGMSELAHHLEDVLDGLRMGRVGFDSPAVALLDEAVLLCADLLVATGDGEATEGLGERVEQLLGRITAAMSGDVEASGDDLGSLDIDPSMLRALTEYEEHRLRENVRKGRTLSLVDSLFEIASFEEGLSELTSAIREVGEVVSTLPSPGEAPESQIRFSLLVATTISAEHLTERLELPETTVRVVHPGTQPEAGPAGDASGAAQPASGVGTAADSRAAAQEARAPSDSGDFESLKSISDTVRVDIRKLDELMTLVGELVIQRTALSEVATRLCDDTSTQRVGRELTKIHKLLDRKLKELQSGVLDVRMVPLRQVFEKLSRVVRRLKRDVGKDVRLEFKGADTELDKLIVEELIDPLVHLVRNAFDHAIEPEAERVRAGKPAEGTIRIEASQRGNHVVIDVSDDGRGIDADSVRARAESLGLVSRDATLTVKETLALVFEPGFSTREEVSETSGRGVGMDVVRSNLTALGGLVDLSSEAGRGTAITLTLPITLAIIQALLVGVGEQRFAVPLNAVLETLLVDESEIQHSEGREILNLRGEPLPLRRLGAEFGIPVAPADAGKVYAVVLGLGDLRMGLLVDRLEGQQDTVIKPIQGPIRQVRGIAGATEMADSGAILVLDVSSFVEDAVRRRDAA